MPKTGWRWTGCGFNPSNKPKGMDAAMFHDARAWERYTAIEARRIKQFLRLSEHPGLEGLEKRSPCAFTGV